MYFPFSFRNVDSLIDDTQNAYLSTHVFGSLSFVRKTQVCDLAVLVNKLKLLQHFFPYLLGYCIVYDK